MYISNSARKIGSGSGSAPGVSTKLDTVANTISFNTIVIGLVTRRRRKALEVGVTSRWRHKYHTPNSRFFPTRVCPETIKRLHNTWPGKRKSASSCGQDSYG